MLPSIVSRPGVGYDFRPVITTRGFVGCCVRALRAVDAGQPPCRFERSWFWFSSRPVRALKGWLSSDLSTIAPRAPAPVASSGLAVKQRVAPGSLLDETAAF